jgi:hypothetical protein
MAEERVVPTSGSPFIRRNQRLLALVALLSFVAAIKLGQQLYRWAAFGEERARISALDSSLQEAGLGVISTQVRSDSIRAVIASIDEQLTVSRDRLDRYERQAAERSISTSTERAYRRELADHNANIRRRNQLFREWADIIDVNHVHVERYNTIVDSIRGLAADMGEPYYPILSPAEIASRNGVPAPTFSNQ